RILGLGYLDTQLKIQVHFLMLLATASVFSLGVGLFIWDFFRYRPQFSVIADAREVPGPGRPGKTAPANPNRRAARAV
ncbi:MAG: hypothetical protein ABI478_06755, partial [Propionivibrio sp.]